jgi:hypothetical protein
MCPFSGAIPYLSLAVPSSMAAASDAALWARAALRQAASTRWALALLAALS